VDLIAPVFEPGGSRPRLVVPSWAACSQSCGCRGRVGAAVGDKYDVGLFGVPG
jgi:hypothetical protein